MSVNSPEELSLFKRVMIRTRGYAYVGHQRRPGWRASIPFYAFKCPEHGIVVDYPHGHRSKSHVSKVFKAQIHGVESP